MQASFDDLVHSPVRLRICAALEAGTGAEFALLEQSLGISTSLLSKHLKVLEDAGYVELDRRRQPVGRPRVWVSFTPQGRDAFRRHVSVLRTLLAATPDPGA